MKATFIAILFISIGLATGAQHNFYFTQVNTSQGLSHPKVNCIIQDSRGFMWMGTDDGLNRYDGKNFTTFRNIPGDTASLSGNLITALLEDKAGVIWIGTADGGLTCYNYNQPALKQFKQYKHKSQDSNSIPVNIINAMAEDEQGFLWLATSGSSVIRFDKQTGKFWKGANTPRKTALSVCTISKEYVWAGGQGGGLLQINTRRLQTNRDTRYDNLYEPLPHVSITSIYKDVTNHIWMGSWDKNLYRLNTALQEEIFTPATIPAFPGDEILSFGEDDAGKLWIGSKTKGLFIYNQTAKIFQNLRHNPLQGGSIAGNTIYCIYRDRHKNIWLGTNDGVSVYKPGLQITSQQFLPFDGEDIIIHDMYVDEELQVWIATAQGLYKKTTQGFEKRSINWNGKALSVSRIYPLQKNEWLLGTNFSLFKYQPSSNQISILPRTSSDAVMNGIISSTIKDIITDTIHGHPVFLTAPYGHFISYYDLKEERWFSRSSIPEKIVTKYDIRDNQVSRFYKTNAGTLWLATDKWGLARWDKQTAFRYYINDPNISTSISNNHVYDIKEDRFHNLWVSTYGGGLHYFNTVSGQFTHIHSSGNLGEGIAVDKNNSVWMIANGHLETYEPHTQKHQIIQLPDLEKKGGVRGQIYSDRVGNMYLTGLNYYIQFRPETLAATSQQPDVIFTNFSIFNQPKPEMLHTSLIRLKPSQNYFSIEFAAPDYSGAPVTYTYRLAGFDDRWIEAGSRNFVSYSNLPGGQYKFEVKASNSRGQWGDKLATLHLKVIPPFWTQWWFYALAALFVSTGIYLLYRYRLNEFKKRQLIRNKIAQDLHDNMGSTLSSISVYSQVASIYHQKNKAGELQTMLEKIGATSSEMIGEMSDIVWAIQPKNDSLHTMILRMESFAKPLLQAKNIRFKFDYKLADQNAVLTMEKRKNFYLVFKEAVNNAIKYANCSELLVQLAQSNKKLSLHIIDNGVGFDHNGVRKSSNNLSGNGLGNMQDRALDVGAEFQIDSEIGKGTSVFLSMDIP